jgi:uncharacterized membrane protein YgcG
MPTITRSRRRVITWSALLAIAVVGAGTAGPAAAQVVECGTYRGLVCEGLFTDEPDVVANPGRIAAAIERVTTTHGNPFAVVIASSTRGEAPEEFAANLANAWGVGDPSEQNGIVVLVAIDERRTEVVTQEGVDLPGRAIANTGRSFFGAGDFEAGVLAIIGAVDQVLAGDSLHDGLDEADEGSSLPVGWVVLGVFLVPGAIFGVGSVVVARRARAASVMAGRNRRIDALLLGLEPGGDDLALARHHAIGFTSEGTVATSVAVQALFDIRANRATATGTEGLTALAAMGAITVVDVASLRDATRVPMDLRASGERPILESGLDGSVAHAMAIDPRDGEAFEVAFEEVREVVQALRPHRVGAARRRAADALIDGLVTTPIGAVTAEPLGQLLMSSAPVLDPGQALRATVDDVVSASELASAKTERVVMIRSSLDESPTRDIASIALADLGDSPEESLRRFASTLSHLERVGAPLIEDGLSLPAVAALLLINNSADAIDTFVSAYGDLADVADPAIALEAAMAGLSNDAELRSVREMADGIGIPIAVAVALRERRDDGPVVYQRILDEISRHADTTDVGVIAGILAVSLEPAIAVTRWLESRTVLASLGLVGSYADVAAAFGASDPRGPRAFALAYAAQRSALEQAHLGDLTRYAPELAHAGTSRQRDSWTDRPLSTSRIDFDPFTFLFLHWAALGGADGGPGWDGLYRSRSWHDGGSGWWDGGGGFGSAGGGSWDTGTWGTPSGSIGGFGGFSGGGGFSGSGGGGW